MSCGAEELRDDTRDSADVRSGAVPERRERARTLGACELFVMSLLPVPTDWPRARKILAPIAERAICDSAPADVELLDAVCRAYRLKHADVAPLLAWEHRP